jgi:hypothetical protein
MRRLGTGLWSVALLGVAVSAAGAQGVIGDGRDGVPTRFAGGQPGNTTWDSLVGPSDKNGIGTANSQPVTAPAGPPVAEQTKRTQKQEQNAFLRRILVCDRLRQIAAETNDAALERQADALAEQAWLIYTRRTKSLHLSGPDAAVLEQNLGTDTAMPRPRAGAPAGDRRAELMGEGRP